MFTKKRVGILLDTALNSLSPFLVSVVILYVNGTEFLGIYTLYFTILMLARVIFQALIVNNFSVVQKKIKFKRNNDLVTQYFSISVLFSLIILLIALILGQFNITLMFVLTYASSEIIKTFQRSVYHIETKYYLNIYHSVLFVAVFILLLLNYLPNLETVSIYYQFLTVSGVVVNISYFLLQKIKLTKLNYKFFYDEILKEGKHQLIISFSNWLRSSSIIYIINFALSSYFVGIYRLLQISFSVISISFNSIESFFPQSLSKINEKKDRKNYIFNSSRIISLLSLIGVFLNVFIIILAREYFNELNIINIDHLIIYSVTVLMFPYTMIMNILYRYSEKLYLLKDYYLIEMIVSIIILAIVSFFENFGLILLSRLIITLIFTIFTFKKIHKDYA